MAGILDGVKSSADRTFDYLNGALARLIGSFRESYSPLWVPEAPLQPVQAFHIDRCAIKYGQSGSAEMLMNNPS